MKIPLLDVKNLSVMFPGITDKQPIPIIKNVSFSLYRNETLGIIGESGSGKSITLLSLMGLIDIEPGIVDGSIQLNTGKLNLDLLHHSKKEEHYRAVRGNEISMIFQNPKLAFNPYYSIGSQINEMIRLHTGIKDKNAAKEIAIEWLERVKMEAPAMRYNNNPYGLSGGMCQRAMIAMALSSEPSILIADEPTTGLDATIQSNIVDLLSEIKQETGISMIVVSHDFNVMRQLTDNIIVYYKGRIIEQGKTEQIFDINRENIHPYTKRLLNANLQGFTDASITPFTDNTNARGCDFCEYCPVKDPHFSQLCEQETPELTAVNDDNHLVRCWKFQHD